MRNLLILILVVLGISSLPSCVSAAVIKIESDFETFHVGDIFTIDVDVDTEGQTINAVEAELIFPAELLEFVSSNDGDSVVNLWIEKPNYHESNKIIFSGITPGGFSNNDASLLSLTFKVVKIGQGNIEISQSNLLLNDGLGTKTELVKQNLHIAINEGDSEIVVNSVDDEVPEHFVPEIIQDADLFAGDYALIFATEDKGSGIDHFEVKEGFLGRYKKAESPYLLEYQTLNKKLSVKAVDQLRNERIEILYPQNWQPWYQHTFTTASILLLCVLTFFISWRFIRSLLKK